MSTEPQKQLLRQTYKTTDSSVQYSTVTTAVAETGKSAHELSVQDDDFANHSVERDEAAFAVKRGLMAAFSARSSSLGLSVYSRTSSEQMPKQMETGKYVYCSRLIVYSQRWLYFSRVYYCTVLYYTRSACTYADHTYLRC